MMLKPLKDRTIIYLALGQTLLWAGLYYIFPALFLRWEESFAWSKPQITGAITIAILLSAIFSPLAGRLIDQGKGPQMMMGSSIIGGLSLFALSFISELNYFYLIWSVIGICMSGCLYEPCFAMITRARGDQAKNAIIMVTLIAGFAGTISFPVVHGLSEISNWNTATRFFAFIIIFIAAPLTWLGSKRLEQSRSNSNHHQQTDNKIKQYNFIKHPTFWFLAIGFAMIAILHGITLHHLLPILHDRGIQSDIAVLAASFIGPMQVLGRLAIMFAEKHSSNYVVGIFCYLITAISILMLYASGSTSVLLTGFVILYGAGYGIVSIIRPVIARDLLGEHNFGAKSGILALIYLSSSAISPYLGALLWKSAGYDLVLLILIGFALTGLVLFVIANRFSNSLVGIGDK